MNDVVSISDRFRFGKGSDGSGVGLKSQLFQAIGVNDGEGYLLRLYPKAGTAIDDDIRALLLDSIRRIRRVLAVPATRDTFVEAVEVVEDEANIGVVLMAAGKPLSELSSRVWAAMCDAARGNRGRLSLWKGMERIAVALNACHGAGLVHGDVGPASVFVESDSLAFRLGGYEAAVALGDAASAGRQASLGRTDPMSFHRDWSGFAGLVHAVFGMENAAPPSLMAAEQRLLDRLASPPRFQILDGDKIVEDVRDVIAELTRIGLAGQGELICYPDRRVLANDLSAVVQGAIPAADMNRLLDFASEDLSSSTTRIARTSPSDCDAVLITDKATYKIKVIEDHIARIIGARERRTDDRVDSARELMQRVKVCYDRRTADERRRKAGPASASWRDAFSFSDESSLSALVSSDDVIVWHALILVEVISLLKEQFAVYPVDVEETNTGVMLLVRPRDDAARDLRRETIKLRPAAEAMERALLLDDGSATWTVCPTDPMSGGQTNLPRLSFMGFQEEGGRRTYLFETDAPLRELGPRFLGLRPDAGTERAMARRLAAIIAARGQSSLLRALADPRQVAIDPVLRHVATPGPPPVELDESKIGAWEAISRGHGLEVIVGPPGVGKTFFVTHLIQRILRITPEARILVSAQNHEALALMERSLKDRLIGDARIVVRTPRHQTETDQTSLRHETRALLRSVSEGSLSPFAEAQRRWIRDALGDAASNRNADLDAALRDTDHLVQRSADVTLATTNSYRIEELIADGEQFDWVIVEEAARATGPELIGPLLLGNRRVIIGDHRQLPPFDAESRGRLYDPAVASALLEDAIERVEAQSAVPPEVVASLKALLADETLRADVLGAAARLEEPFRTIVELEEERSRGALGGPVSMLQEQSRMHPAICALVSEVFYEGALMTSARIQERTDVINAKRIELSAPIVLLDLPALSTRPEVAFESRAGSSYVNEAEAAAICEALGVLTPIHHNRGGSLGPTLAILSPYGGQVDRLRSRISRLINQKNALLQGFTSAKGDGEFVHTVDGFQGGEADLVIVSLVRNNTKVGQGAVGFLRNRQRMNVLLSRARHKLVLVTSRHFLLSAVNGTDPDHMGTGELGHLRAMIETVDRLAATRGRDGRPEAAIVSMDARGRFL